MKKFTLFCLALCAMAFYSLPLRADGEVLIDSIYYKLDDATKTASVVPYYPDTYVGHSKKLVIPSQVKHGGKTYTVTRICQIQSYTPAIEEVKLPGSITKIDAFAFSYIRLTLKRINIPANIESFTDSIFGNPDPRYAGKQSRKLKNLIVESPLVLKYYADAFLRGEKTSPTNYMSFTGEKDGQYYSYWSTVMQLDTLTIVGDAGDTIPQYACKNWRELKVVNLPKYNTVYIGANAFDSCGIGNINLAELQVLNTIENSAFKNCKHLENGDLPESVTKLGMEIFWGCEHLRHASLPSSTTVIPPGMYRGCQGPLEITLPKNTEMILSEAFFECSFSNMITIPSTVTLIDQSAFEEAKFPGGGTGGERHIILPKGLKEVRTKAFFNAQFDHLTVKSELTSLQTLAFATESGKSNIKEVTINNKSIINLTSGLSGYRRAYFTFGRDVQKYTITDADDIPERYFENCEGLQEIDFTQASVQKIYAQAFKNCTSLKSINTDNAKVIYPNAFEGCTSLESVDLMSVTEIMGAAFLNCSALKDIYLGPAQTIAANAFDGCTSIAAFSAYSDKYFNTEGGILYNSDKTQLIIFPRESENFALDDYELPASVTSIYCDAFDYCTHLHSITSTAATPPALVEKNNHESKLFQYGIDRLVRIYVPEASISAYKSVWGTNHCEYYAIQSGTCTVDGITYQFNANQTASVINGTTPYSGDVVIPATFEYGGKTYQVNAIADNTFDDCSDLTSISLPEGLLTIGHAFGNCTGLTSLTLPRTLTSIGWNAFRYCTSLSEIICKAVNPPTCGMELTFTAFRNVPATTPLWVPNGSVSKYQEATCWKNFKDNTYPFAANCSDVNHIDGGSKAFLKPVSVAFVSGKYVYIQDETGTTMLYLNAAADASIYAGAKIAGIEGKTELYNGLPEIKPTNAVSTWTITDDGDEPVVKTITEVPDYDDINQLVKIENLTLEAEFSPSKPKEVTISLSDGTIILRNQFSLTQTFVAGKYYDILAGVAISDPTFKLYLIQVLAERDTPTGLDQITNDQSQMTNKVIYDGRLYILRDGKIYTVTGQIVK